MFVCALAPASAQDSGIGGYFANWFPRVTKTQAEQPHWITPLYTTTPRLEEEFRVDTTWTPATGGESESRLHILAGLSLLGDAALSALR